MIHKKILIPLSLCCMTQLLADSGQIPEGKITDYHCIHPDITPAAGPRVIDGFDVFLTGDYLYWTAREDNLQFASTGYSNDSSSSVSSGSSKTPNFDYKSAFKAGLGLNLGHDSWDTHIYYTWFRSKNNTNSINADYDDGLTPYFEPYLVLGDPDFFSYAHTIWKIQFNNIDWEVGRNCYLSKYLSIRPFAGLKGSWQKQHFNNSYSGEAGVSSFTYDNNNRLSFWGVGVRAGMNTSWHLSESWSLFGDLALSALWSKFTAHRKDTYSMVGDDTTPVQVKATSVTVTPVLELAVGLRKDAWFHHDRFHISLQGGWEQQIWWDMNQFLSNLGNTRGGNLLFQGLTARLRFDF